MPLMQTQNNRFVCVLVLRRSVAKLVQDKSVTWPRKHRYNANSITSAYVLSSSNILIEYERMPVAMAKIDIKSDQSCSKYKFLFNRILLQQMSISWTHRASQHTLRVGFSYAHS